MKKCDHIWKGMWHWELSSTIYIPQNYFSSICGLRNIFYGKWGPQVRIWVWDQAWTNLLKFIQISTFRILNPSSNVEFDEIWRITVDQMWLNSKSKSVEFDQSQSFLGLLLVRFISLYLQMLIFLAILRYKFGWKNSIFDL